MAWKQQINYVTMKLNKANVMLSKLRHFWVRKTLKSVYYAILESHVRYASLVWVQDTN